jgi:uncharacterized protein (DUF1800 family)
VDWLLDFPDKPAEEQDAGDQPNMTAIQDYPPNMREMAQMYVGKPEDERRQMFQKMQQANRAAEVSTAGWWMNRMAWGKHAMQEKLALFWHGHFPTSVREERMARLMWRQNETLRRHAAGNFGAFVKAISRDPAMLDYLNNQQNVRFHPNENYARELMELFTLGLGHYTEDDVKNAARAFTGWGHDGTNYVFRRFDHDFNDKTFLGRRGNFDGDDVVDIILEQPACAPYVASRVWDFFVSEEPNEPVTQALGDLLRGEKYDLRPMLKTLFTSKAFYASQVIGAQIKSPVQLVVGTARLLGTDLPPARMSMQPNGPLNQMGQVPMAPPNVKGWPGGRSWINTSTLFVRCNTAMGMAREAELEPAATADATVDKYLARLIQRPVAPEQRQPLLDAVGDKPTVESTRRMVQLIVSMPEYQLC